MFVGEFTAKAEQIRYNLLEDRTVGFPRSYDRFHLSNVPGKVQAYRVPFRHKQNIDYIGGTYAWIIYASKITKTKKSSMFTSICLRNTPLWNSLDEFNNEYFVVNDADTLSKVAHLKCHRMPADPIWPMGNYIYLQRSTTKRLPLSSLLPRKSLHKWLIAFFFKMVLPCESEDRA